MPTRRTSVVPARGYAACSPKTAGFGSFDADNTDYYLNAIPLADHGALLDPPTSDVTARCLIQLCLKAGGGPSDPRNQRAIRRALAYLRSEQERDGSWFGRWGTNYIYGTWSVLTALEVAGEDPSQDYIRRAVRWLKSVQQADGGWGESNDTYLDPSQAGMGLPGTSYQTAWALLALMAAGEVHSAAVRRGIHFLLSAQRDDGLWQDESFTAPGFPRVFYLRYHGYSRYFPLWGAGPLSQLERPASLKPAGILCAMRAEAACLARRGLVPQAASHNLIQPPY